MKNKLVMLLACAILTGLFAGCSQKQEPDKGYNPVIDPDNFVAVVDNPYFTLEQGMESTYITRTKDGTEKEITVVTDQTKEIMGINSTVVWDRVWLDDVLIEETFDWYAQDKEGNVWYLGEDSKEYENGTTSTAGSWEAGADGAKPGIIMEANPKVSDSYRQEYLKGEAEDMADVISLDETVTVPYGIFENCLKTRDWSKVETSLNEYKYYSKATGGVVLEIAIDSEERTELTAVTTSAVQTIPEDTSSATQPAN